MRLGNFNSEIPASKYIHCENGVLYFSDKIWINYNWEEWNSHEIVALLVKKLVQHGKGRQVMDGHYAK